MELYILDGLLRRVEVVDQYESLIWTDRYREVGDFELVIASTPTNRQRLVNGQLLALNESDRVMKIDEVEDKDDSEGRSLLTIKGPSLEIVMDDRAARPADSTLKLDPKDPDSTEKKWIISDTPGNVARQLFNTVLRDGAYDVNDKLPFLTQHSTAPVFTNPEPSVPIDAIMDIKGSVLDNMLSLTEKFDLGFRLWRNLDNSQLFFDIYAGDNRTSTQSQFPAVVFSQALGNLNDTSYLTTSKGIKNVAYVIAPKGSRKVYYQGYDASISGFDRKVLTVDASDITLAAGTDLQNALEKRGQEELAKYQAVQGMDGTISQYTGYQYMVDYDIGDIVEMRNPDGVTSQVRVTEVIHVSDSSGERTYPTLTANLFIPPGSWYSGIGNHAWDDASGAWYDQ